MMTKVQERERGEGGTELLTLFGNQESMNGYFYESFFTM